MLINLRHERFALAVIRTGVAAKAYIEAGYAPTTRNALDVSACQLLRTPKVQARINELRKEMAGRNRITLDTLLDDLEAARVQARQLGQPSAAIAATMSKARLVGLLVDRRERGAPGEFAAAESEAQVLDRVKAELGHEAATALANALAKHDLNHPDS